MQYPPPLPELPDEQRANGRAYLRYEDVSQDGRIQLQGVPHSLGLVVWRKLLLDHPVNQLAERAGIVPILTRIVISGTRGTVSVGQALDSHGAFELGHTVDTDGEVDRLILRIWVELSGPQGLTRGAGPDDGKHVTLGSVFAEHVFTRLFAPKGARKVTRFEDAHMPEVPTKQYQWRPLASVAELPKGARWLDDAWHIDPAPAVFGLAHTDSNQHVNSLVYPRLFEDASLRYLATLGQSTKRLSRVSDTSFRKPCFAGGRARIAVRAYVHGDEVGTTGCFITDEAADAPDHVLTSRPYCFLRTAFSE